MLFFFQAAAQRWCNVLSSDMVSHGHSRTVASPMALSLILLAMQSSHMFISPKGTWLLSPLWSQSSKTLCKRWVSWTVAVSSEQPRATYSGKMSRKGRKPLCFTWPGWCPAGQAESKIRGGQALRRPREGTWSRSRPKVKLHSEGSFLQRHREAWAGAVPPGSHRNPLDRSAAWRRGLVLHGLNGQGNTQRTRERSIICTFIYNAQCLSVCT